MAPVPTVPVISDACVKRRGTRYSSVDPLHPRNVLPARIYKLGKQYFGGRVFAEEVLSVRELNPETPG